MLTAVVARPPRFGAVVRGFDAAAAKAAPGVTDVVQISTGVAVVAKLALVRPGADAICCTLTGTKARLKHAARRNSSRNTEPSWLDPAPLPGATGIARRRLREQLERLPPISNTRI